MKPGLVIFFSVYAEFWTVNVDISLSLLRVFKTYIDVCLIYLSVNRPHGVGKVGEGWGEPNDE